MVILRGRGMEVPPQSKEPPQAPDLATLVQVEPICYRCWRQLMAAGGGSR